ncbi:hypothetical protein HCUR_01136 [Holospora curviuscula]|uniref:Uncharacterized protein n=1 Tax=Holospora curviuscula TaxID=1082868 RepID=A0A2S5R7Y2_9PROT|nr:hypothetical protein HCUR_01136 [Holospora curviuscula]
MSKKPQSSKPQANRGFGDMRTFPGVFACIGDREGKKGDFGGKMAKLEKVRYGSNAKQKRWKACRYWGFETY